MYPVIGMLLHPKILCMKSFMQIEHNPTHEKKWIVVEQYRAVQRWLWVTQFVCEFVSQVVTGEEARDL